jgi:hypothetical protein
MNIKGTFCRRCDLHAIENEKNKARIEELEAALDTWQVQYQNGRDLSHIDDRTTKILNSETGRDADKS